MPESPRLDLTVNVPADDQAVSRRRVAYLETLLIGVADRAGLAPEWHSVERLAGLWGSPKPAPTEPESPAPGNVVPAQVLSLMRLVWGEARGDLAGAWAILPHRLPAGVAMPGEREAAIVLLRLGQLKALPVYPRMFGPRPD